jgi:hypothetical protein
MCALWCPIDESIHLYDELLLLLSEHSVQSMWVQDEVEAALGREQREKRLVLFPIRIDDEVEQTTQAWATAIHRKRHIGDFSDNGSCQLATKRMRSGSVLTSCWQTLTLL